MRLSTKTGFFLSSFLSGLPDLTSFVVYVRLLGSVTELRLSQKVVEEAYKSNLKSEMLV